MLRFCTESLWACVAQIKWQWDNLSPSYIFFKSHVSGYLQGEQGLFGAPGSFGFPGPKVKKSEPVRVPTWQNSTSLMLSNIVLKHIPKNDSKM